ncbi:MAG: guanylate kinase [Leptospirales bacterium]|nr:guanylate kinase [Leptospirales bacterium]
MIFVISAPSGAGKTTLINKLLKFESRLMFSVSNTTRGIRENEIDGINYYFISKDEFCKMIDNDEFVEWAEVYDNYYGTTKNEILRIIENGKIPLFDVDIQGSVSLRKKIKNGTFVFIIPPSYDDLKRRLIERKTENQEQLNLRLKNAYKEINEYSNFEYIIINDKVDVAFEQLRAIVITNFKPENEVEVPDELFIMADRCKLENMKDKVDRILEGFK